MKAKTKMKTEAVVKAKDEVMIKAKVKANVKMKTKIEIKVTAKAKLKVNVEIFISEKRMQICCLMMDVKETGVLIVSSYISPSDVAKSS
ncbi:hypothetical protein COCNU_08G006440 [Cocos nucifera]|uniref:Uncharacterized protein n=1 Tax=Cocos nucifera TaxID=13894 RepID=A0A8K0IHT0_COCNU|nr:hypothetical protein COCNU_08G006440 [Cocos nucifera]